MAKFRFLVRDLVIDEAAILVVGFTATNDVVLRTSYGFVYVNVCLNVADFPLDKNANNSTEVKKNIYLSRGLAG